jgi:hypothetical protein
MTKQAERASAVKSHENLIEPVAIASGQTTSAAIDVSGKMIAAIDVPTVTSTALTLQNSVDDTNYRPIYDNAGNALSYTIASNRTIRFEPPLIGYEKIKVVLGSAEGADRVLNLVLVP